MSELTALAAELPSAADPAAFRTDYRRQRWYVDPLPTCDVAEATSDRWPALSTLKRAWNSTFRKRWSGDEIVYDLDPLRVALYADANWTELATRPTAERVPMMARSAAADLNTAAARGGAVHDALDLLLHGNEEAAAHTCHPDYWATVQRLITDVGIELVHAERVAISRTEGWAGTFDGIVAIDQRHYLVDWKTRGADSNHGAYEAEAAQLGGYALADYFITEAPNGTAQRTKLPPLAGALVISIKPDDWEIYPIDLGHAAEAVRGLRDAWKTVASGKSAGRKAVGKPWRAKPQRAEVEPPDVAIPTTRNEWIEGRITTLVASRAAKAMLAQHWPADTPKRAPWTPEQIDAIVPVLVQVETAVEAPFPYPDPEAPKVEVLGDWAPTPQPGPTEWSRPLDGDLVPEQDVNALKAHAAKVMDEHPERAMVVQAWRNDAKRQGAPWGGVIDGCWTQRCWVDNHAALRCAIELWDDDEPDTLTRAAIAWILDEDLQPTWSTGALIGSLSIEQAQRLEEIAASFHNDHEICAAVGRRITAA